MNLIQIVVLALIQGAAELLPVSSSAHVIVAERLMGLDPSSPEMTFLLVMLHTGTMFAVLFYFRHRWKRILLSPERRSHFARMLVVATACTGVVGFGLKKAIEKIILEHALGFEKGEIENLFGNLPLVAAALFAAGLLIIWAGRREKKPEPITLEPIEAPEKGLTTRASIWIGVVQGLCLPFRGFSRSGATVSTALLKGISRETAEDFSFALAVILTPPVIVLELQRLLKHADGGPALDLSSLLAPGALGMVFSLASGLIALRVLSAWLENGRWRFFGYYCVTASLVVGGLHFSGWV